jgi:DNA-binding GntR family transcriptional regulator
VSVALKISRPPSLVEAAAERLTDAIVRGELKAGQRLIENDLSASLGISRAPLREALRTLASEGLVEIRRSRGAVVASPTDDDIEHLILFRSLVEGAAARLVAFRRDARVLDSLAVVLRRMEAAARRGDARALLGEVIEFHGCLCHESGNPYLLQAWGIAGNLTRLYLQRAMATIDLEAALINHRSILRALRESSPEEAESFVRSVILDLAYDLLGREMPRSIRGYVDRRYKAASAAIDHVVTPRRSKKR